MNFLETIQEREYCLVVFEVDGVSFKTIDDFELGTVFSWHWWLRKRVGIESAEPGLLEERFFFFFFFKRIII